MNNSMNSINNISMRGNLAVTTWHNMKPKRYEFRTSSAQDQLVREFLKGKSELLQETPLSRGNSEFIHKLFEYFTGKTFGEGKAKKIVHDNRQSIHIYDSGYKLNDGVEFILEL